jgi:hypothetical protein
MIPRIVAIVSLGGSENRPLTRSEIPVINPHIESEKENLLM